MPLRVIIVNVLPFIAPYLAIVGNYQVCEDEEEESMDFTIQCEDILKSMRSLNKTFSEATNNQIQQVMSSLELTDGERITQELAHTVGIDLYRVCAYNGFGISSLFESIANKLIKLEGNLLTKMDDAQDARDAQDDYGETARRQDNKDCKDSQKFKQENEVDLKTKSFQRKKKSKSNWSCFCLPRR